MGQFRLLYVMWFSVSPTGKYIKMPQGETLATMHIKWLVPGTTTDRPVYGYTLMSDLKPIKAIWFYGRKTHSASLKSIPHDVTFSSCFPKARPRTSDLGGCESFYHEDSHTMAVRSPQILDKTRGEWKGTAFSWLQQEEISWFRKYNASVTSWNTPVVRSTVGVVVWLSLQAFWSRTETASRKSTEVKGGFLKSLGTATNFSGIFPMSLQTQEHVMHHNVAQ